MKTACKYCNRELPVHPLIGKGPCAHVCRNPYAPGNKLFTRSAKFAPHATREHRRARQEKTLDDASMWHLGPQAIDPHNVVMTFNGITLEGSYQHILDSYIPSYPELKTARIIPHGDGTYTMRPSPARRGSVTITCMREPMFRYKPDEPSPLKGNPNSAAWTWTGRYYKNHDQGDAQADVSLPYEPRDKFAPRPKVTINVARSRSWRLCRGVNGSDVWIEEYNER